MAQRHDALSRRDRLVINTPADIRAAHLAKRGREDETAIRARLAREVPVYAASGKIYHLDNSGPLPIARDVLVALLRDAANALVPRGHAINQTAP